MRYGIATPAATSSDNWAALRTAWRLYRSGRDFSIYALDGRYPALEYPLTGYRVSSRVSWFEWVSRLDVLLLFRAVPQYLLAATSRSVKLVFVDMTISPWSQWLAAAHTYASQVWVADNRCVPPLSTTRYVEMLWEPGLTTVSPDVSVEGVLFPLWELSPDYDFREIEAGLRVLQHHRHVPLTVAYCRSQLRRRAQIALRRWQKLQGRRMQLLAVSRDVPYRLFTTHSLCFWPATAGGIGWTPMVAASLGCAVFTLPIWPYDRVFQEANAFGRDTWDTPVVLSYSTLEERFDAALRLPRMPQRRLAQSVIDGRQQLSDAAFTQFVAAIE